MLGAHELARIQRAIDGLSSPGSSNPSSPCDFLGEPVENQLSGPESAPRDKSLELGQAAKEDAQYNTTEGQTRETKEDRDPKTRAEALKVPSEDEEEFNIHLLLKQRRQRRTQQQQHESDEQPAPLPAADVALQEAAERVRQRQARLEEEAAERAARNARDEVQHVSSSGQWGGSRRPDKKAQQVYVGLPVGVGWHVPLVGVEGRGGYKPAQGEAEKKSPAESHKRALTVKEREKLKRKKGQSSHATWKPETWMQLRQQYD